ncbi:MAG: restriction endonuclease [Cellulosilyticaceae bacterium]
MSKVYRVILFVGAIYMYYLFIIDTEDPIAAVGKIILVAMLLIAMELIRRGSSKLFDANSKLEEIDQMDKEKFIKYIGELYRRQGYQVYILQDDKKLGCDIKAYKPKDSLCIKCIHGDEEMIVERNVIDEAYSSIKLYKVKRCIVITNTSFSEEADVVAKGNQVSLIDRIELHNLIYKIINKEDKSSEMTKVQEA